MCPHHQAVRGREGRAFNSTACTQITDERGSDEAAWWQGIRRWGKKWKATRLWWGVAPLQLPATPVHVSHAAEWRLWFFFFLSFFYYALQPTLVPSPSLPTSPPAVQGLKDRQPHQSAVYPKKFSPPLSPVLGPGWLLRSPAGPAQRMPSASTAASLG